MSDLCEICETKNVDILPNDLATNFHLILSRISRELSANIQNLTLLDTCMSGWVHDYDNDPKSPGEFSKMDIVSGLRYIENMILTETTIIEDIRGHFGMSDIRMISADDLCEEERNVSYAPMKK